MPSLQSHLTVLETAASRFSSLPAFRIAKKSQSGADVESWSPISYQQFLEDVELAARYWHKKLSADGLPSKAVVGLW